MFEVKIRHGIIVFCNNEKAVLYKEESDQWFFKIDDTRQFSVIPPPQAVKTIRRWKRNAEN